MSEGFSNHATDLLRIIGPRLKAAREAKDMTIQEISSRTRINVIFLQQIENAHSDNLPGLTFVRGFVRNYLQVLELQDEEIESALNQISGLEQYKAETELGPRINEMHGDDDWQKVPMRRNVILAMALVVVLALAYMGVRVLLQSGDEAPATAAKEQSAESLPQREEPAEKTPTQAPPPSGRVKSVAKSLPVASAQNLRLTVRGLESTWLRVSIDRAPPVEVQLAPAETMNWEANEEFRLIIGKSHGVAVYLNGEDILMPAERNRLIPDVVLNKLTLLRLEN